MENNSIISFENKKMWAVVLVLFLISIAIIWTVFYEPPFERLIGDNFSLQTFSENGEPAGGIFSIPFLKSFANIYVSGAVDSNSNGKFEPEEWLAKNTAMTGQKGWNSNLPFKSGKKFGGDAYVRIVVSPKKLTDDELVKKIKDGNYKEKTILVIDTNLNNLYGTEKPLHPEISMKEGNGGQQANANQVGPDNSPDFSQRIAECGPTVAANGLYSLALKNGAKDKLPQNPLEMIDSLKGDMSWTPADGVIVDNFVAGKNKWAVTHGLPIKTETIGDQDGRGTLDDVKKALAKGAAVEVRLRFFDEDLKIVGGHIVTVKAVKEVDGQTILEINDPLTPTGTESYPISLGSLSNYPFHDGEVGIGIAFSQTWEGAPMGGGLDTMTEAEMRGMREFTGEKKTIKAIKYQDKLIPLTDVHIGKGDHCDSKENSFPHWHSNQNFSAKATDGTVVPDNNGCGYGKAKDVEVVDVDVP